MQDLGQKMMDVIIKYATQNGYSMVLDVSSQQTPVLWADPSADRARPSRSRPDEPA